MLSSYKPQIARELIEGFSRGFRLSYEGPRESRDCKNLPSALKMPTLMKEKIDKEVTAGRYLGPFDRKPFDNLICSPMGLVPKHEPGEFRPIMHLSWPKGGSINDYIDPAVCKVQYKSFDHAVQLVVSQGRGAYMARTDLKSAFRGVPVNPDDWPLLGIQFQGQYYVDICLPFGCSISCAIFEKFSTFLDWYVQKATGNPLSHYLDDFFFCNIMKQICNRDMSTFFDVCKDVNFPVAMDKTFWAAQFMVFLGLGLDSVAQMIVVPEEKRIKALNMIFALLFDQQGKPRHKAKVHEIASLAGLLNFLCRAVKPGRAFLDRLYGAVGGLPQHYHVSITVEVKKDLHMWREFLTNFSGSTPFPSKWKWEADQLEFYTDSAGSIGFGVFFEGKWAQGAWPKEFLRQAKPSIALLEFFPIVVGVYLWGDHLKDRRVVFNSDNMAVVNIINTQSSSCPLIMALVRVFVICCLTNNTSFKAKFIRGKSNEIADAISRFQMQRFWRLVGDNADPCPTPLPPSLWPISLDMLKTLPY